MKLIFLNKSKEPLIYFSNIEIKHKNNNTIKVHNLCVDYYYKNHIIKQYKAILNYFLSLKLKKIYFIYINIFSKLKIYTKKKLKCTIL